MAGFRSVGAAGKNIEAVFNVAFADDPPVVSHATHAVLIRTDDLDLSAGSLISPTPALSILLYRIDFNQTMRPNALAGAAPLPGVQLALERVPKPHPVLAGAGAIGNYQVGIGLPTTWRKGTLDISRVFRPKQGDSALRAFKAVARVEPAVTATIKATGIMASRVMSS